MECRSCSELIKMSRWESWNGFLVRCHRCGELNGRYWRAKPIVVGSILFNALAFLFTLRPTRALIGISVFAAIAIVGTYFGLIDTGNPLIDVGAVVAFFFSPAVINGVLVLRHNQLLDTAQPMAKSVEDIAEEVVQEFIQ